MNKATDTHVEHVIGFAFPGQQWLCERAWILRYTYIVCVIVILMVGSDYVRVKLRPPITSVYILSIWTHGYRLLVERMWTWGPKSRGNKKPIPMPVCPLQFPYELVGIRWEKPASRILRCSTVNYGFHNKWNSRGRPSGVDSRLFWWRLAEPITRQNRAFC